MGMSGEKRPVKKPKALVVGSEVAPVDVASPADPMDVLVGFSELKRLDLEVSKKYGVPGATGYFAGTTEERRKQLVDALTETGPSGAVAVRGGYGSNYLLDEELEHELAGPRCVIGYSDVTSLQIYLWQRLGWVTVHGPMVAAGLNAGAGARKGYDEKSLLNAVRNTSSGWELSLEGETLADGTAEGRLLGGCMTLVEATFGTPWELDTRGAILLLEDRAMKPYQVDRALMHFFQAGKLKEIRGIVLGEFPDSAPAAEGSPTVREVCARVLCGLGVPVVYGAPVGHTTRPMLTLPLGVPVRLRGNGAGTLEILEPAVEA
jgi:muramoyltetrapeptide carboxypeptidase